MHFKWNLSNKVTSKWLHTEYLYIFSILLELSTPHENVILSTEAHCPAGFIWINTYNTREQDPCGTTKKILMALTGNTIYGKYKYISHK